jgi:hypothetical protein
MSKLATLKINRSFILMLCFSNMSLFLCREILIQTVVPIITINQNLDDLWCSIVKGNHSHHHHRHLCCPCHKDFVVNLVNVIDIESLQNRLLKVCYVPATSAGLSRLLFIFLRWSLTVLMKQTRQAVCAFNRSILPRCLWSM